MTDRLIKYKKIKKKTEESKTMTYAEREKIFSKETIRTSEIAELYDISLSEASQLVMRIKRTVGDRIGIKGRLHVQDYLNFFKLNGNDKRYMKKTDEGDF